MGKIKRSLVNFVRLVETVTFIREIGDICRQSPIFPLVIVFSVLNTLGLVQCTVVREEWDREIMLGSLKSAIMDNLSR